MAFISKRRRKNYLVGDLDCIFNERLVDSDFLTPAMIAEDYEKLTERNLENDLAFIEENLFDVVEAQFFKDFVFDRRKKGAGFYRIPGGEVQIYDVKQEESSKAKKLSNESSHEVIDNNIRASETEQIEKHMASNEEKSDGLRNAGAEIEYEIVRAPLNPNEAIVVPYIESWHHQKVASNIHLYDDREDLKAPSFAIPLAFPNWQRGEESGHENVKDAPDVTIKEVVTRSLSLKQPSLDTPLPPSCSEDQKLSSTASGELLKLDVKSEAENNPPLLVSARKFRLFKRRPNIYPKSESKGETFQLSEPLGVISQPLRSVETKEGLSDHISGINELSISIQKDPSGRWYDEFGLDDFDLEEEGVESPFDSTARIFPKPDQVAGVLMNETSSPSPFPPESLSMSQSSTSIVHHDLVEENLKLPEMGEVKEIIEVNDRIQFYTVENQIQNYEKTFTQKNRQAAEIMRSLDFISTPPSWLSSTIGVGCVFDCLLKLNDFYPKGCTAEQLAEFETSLGLSMTQTLFPCFASLYDRGLLSISGGLFFVTANVLTRYVFLRKNFCSNFYRLLRSNNGMVTMQSLKHVENLVPPNISINARDVIALCNRYPLLFSLLLSKDDNYCIEHAIIELNKKIPDWMVILDCEANRVQGGVCDCPECICQRMTENKL